MLICPHIAYLFNNLIVSIVSLIIYIIIGIENFQFCDSVLGKYSGGGMAAGWRLDKGRF